MKKAGGAVDTFVSNVDKGASGVGKAGQVMIGALREVGAMAVEALAEAGKAVGAFIADSVTMAGDFEAGTNRLASVAGDSLEAAGVSIDDVRKKALEMGAATQFSAGQAQDAMTELIKGGVPVADVMGDATQATLDLAAAAGIELAPAADIVAKQLGVWAKEGVTAAEITNLVTQAANASTVEAQELADGMANAQGQAQALGLEYKDFVTTMALVAPAFSSSQEAGTSYKNFLVRLQPQTKSQISAMRELGLVTEDGTSKFFDAEGQYIGGAAAAQLLQDATRGLTDAKRAELLQVIFGNDGMGVANALLREGAAGYDRMTGSMQAAGTATEQAAIRNQGFNFALESVKGSIETLQIVLGSQLLPLLATFLNAYIIPIVNALTAFGQGDTFTGFTTLAGILMPINQGLGQFVASLALASDPMATLVQAIDSVIPGFSAFVGFVQQIPAYLSQLGGVLAPLLPLFGGWQGILIGVGAVLGGVVIAAIAGFVAAIAPVVGIVVGVTAAIAALYAAWQNNFLGIQDVTNTVLNGIMSLVAAVLPQITAFWSTHGAEITGFVQTTWNAISSIVSGALQVISTLVSGVLQVIAFYISTHGEEIQAILNIAWTTISTIITTVLAVIQGVVQTAVAIMQGDWAAAWEAIKTTTATVIDGMLTLIEANLALVQTIFQTSIADALAVVQSFIGDFTEVGGDIVQGIIDGVSSAASSLFSAVADLAQGALDAAMSAIGISSPSKDAADDIGKPFVRGIIKGVLDEQPDLFKALADTAEDMLDVFETLGDQIARTISEALESVSSQLRGRQGFRDFLADFVQGPEAERARQDEAGAQERLADLARERTDLEAEYARERAEILATSDFEENKRRKLAELEEEYAERRRDAQQEEIDAQRELEEATKRREEQERLLVERRELAYAAEVALKQAEDEAAQITDPRQRSAFLRMRQAQIQEMTEAQARVLAARAAIAAEGGDAFAEQFELSAAEGALAQLEAAQAAERADFAAGLLTAMDEGGQAIGDAVIQAVLAGLGTIGTAFAEVISAALGGVRIEPRAAGGPVLAGRPYLVGEEGPELFWPGQSGRIQPTASAAQMAASTIYNQQRYFEGADLRGANWTRPQLVSLFNQVLDTRTARADAIARTRGYRRGIA